MLSYQVLDIAPILEDEKELLTCLQTEPEYFNQELSYYQNFEWRIKSRLIIIRLFVDRTKQINQSLSPEVLSQLEAYLDIQLSGSEKWGMTRLQTEILVTLSLVYKQIADQGKSLACLKKAINLAAAEDSLSVFTTNVQGLAVSLKTLQKQGYNKDFLNRILSGLSPSEKNVRPAIKVSDLSSDHSVEKLSLRELDVLKLVAKGNSNREISSQLFISLNTVKTHTSSIYNKLGVNNRAQAVSIALRSGIL